MTSKKSNTTSFPDSLSPFPPLSSRRETLVAAGHVAPKIWVLLKFCIMGGVVM